MGVYFTGPGVLSEPEPYDKGWMDSPNSRGKVPLPEAWNDDYNELALRKAVSSNCERIESEETWAQCSQNITPHFHTMVPLAAHTLFSGLEATWIAAVTAGDVKEASNIRG
jgi:hypothetical protein